MNGNPLVKKEIGKELKSQPFPLPLKENCLAVFLGQTFPQYKGPLPKLKEIK